MIRLRELREKNKLTLEQVAKALDLKNQYVSNYELEKRRPDYETLKKFADFYNVTIDYILERDSSIDMSYSHVLNQAQKDGFTADDITLALKFIKEARESSAKNKK